METVAFWRIVTETAQKFRQKDLLTVSLETEFTTVQQVCATIVFNFFGMKKQAVQDLWGDLNADFIKEKIEKLYEEKNPLIIVPGKEAARKIILPGQEKTAEFVREQQARMNKLKGG